MQTSSPCAAPGAAVTLVGPVSPLRLRRLFAAALAVAGIVAVGGCELAGASSAPEQPKRGGTLYINVQGGVNNLDPQRVYEVSEVNVSRLLDRTLTTYRSVPGDGASEIVPDLATDTGRPSENNTVWAFTLKPNVRWQEGEPVTCTQVKYGISRRFSRITDAGGNPVMDQGASYPLTYLKDTDGYLGPWVGNDNDGKGLESIECLDERNIVFHLKQPVGDFGYTVAMSTWAPVLPEKDTKVNYTNIPYANGPYKIESRDADGMVLVRNKFWTEVNDQVRKAYPDQIIFDYRPDTGGVLTNEMIEDQGDARNTVVLNGNVAGNFLQQVVNDPDLVTRTITGTTGSVRFMAINTRVVPNIECRKALIYAFNKRKWRAAYGGSVLGDYANTIIPPGLRAHKDFDVFDSLSNPEGDPDRAIAIMDEQAKAGKPCDSVIRVAYRDVPTFKRPMNVVVEAYQLAGVEVKLVPLARTTYYATGIGDTSNNYHMMLGGWLPDWANGSTVIPPLFDGRQIPKPDPVTGRTSGNINWSLLDDADINEQMDAALAETSLERQWALWGDLDQQIQEKAVSIPILFEKTILLSGTNVRGGFIHPMFAEPDLCVLGLADPKLGQS